MAAPTNLDTSRLRLGDLIAGGAGLVLIISLFLEWYNVSAKSAFANVSQGVSGWEALSFIDLLLFLIGAIAIAVAVMRALNVLPKSLPASPGLIVMALGGLAVLLTLFRLLSIPDEGAGSLPGIDVGRSIGVFLAFLASLGVAAGGWMGWNEEGKPKPGGAGAGAPGGAGPGIGAGPQFGGAPQAGAPAPAQPAAAQPAAAAPAQPQATAPAAAGGGAKADWYPDPRGEKRLRYWDGSQWTDHTAD